jgi:hypothetical protein
MKKHIQIIILAMIFTLIIECSVQADFNIILNFDDAYEGVYINAFPLMEKYKLRGVTFVPTNYINQNGHMFLSQLKELKSHGWEIGSHTVHHPNLGTLTIEGISSELINSRLYLLENELINEKYSSFCSPNCIWNNKIAKISSEIYQIVRAIKLYRFPDNIEIPALIKVIIKTTRPESIIEWIDNALKEDKTLILVFHEIGKGGNEYYYPPDKLEEILAIISKHRDRVITFYNLFQQIKNP